MYFSSHRHFDSQRRNVYPHDHVTFLLEEKRDPTRAAAEFQNFVFGAANCLSLMPRPVFMLRKMIFGTAVAINVASIPLN